MTPGSPHVITSPSQAWKLIEQDYTLRLSLVASEWSTEHLKAWNSVFAEGRKRGNAAYCGPALVEMEIADADRRAEWAVDTCYEIWEIQGRANCRLFFRAIFDWCLQPMLSVREGCFKQGLELHGRRTREIPQGNSAILRHMKREMAKLRAKWNTKLEIATRENDYQQQSIRAHEPQQARTLAMPIVIASENNDALTTAQLRAIASSLTWKELRIRFRDIQDEPTGPKVSATFTRTKWDSGVITEEWHLSGHPVRRKDFEHLVTIAARKLGCAPDVDANKHWLDRVRVWMQNEGLDKATDVAWLPTGMVSEGGSIGTTKHLITERIAELSAMFCMEMMTRGTPESATSLPPEWLEAANPFTETLSAPVSTGARKRAGRKRTRNGEFDALAGSQWMEEKKAAIGWKIEIEGLERIARKLDEAGFKKPADYLEHAAAVSLNTHNRNNGHSPNKITSWSDLVLKGDKDQLAAMRKVLGRCASSRRKCRSDLRK
jgi:hypothetical protein